MTRTLFLFFILFLTSSAAVKAHELVKQQLGTEKKEFSEEDRGSRVSWCRLKFLVHSSSRHMTDWHSHPSGDVKMIQVLRDYTNINLKQEWNVVDINDLDKMCAFPLLFVHGQCPIDINKQAEDNLKEYILRGGFLLVDDCKFKDHPIPDQFFRSMVKKLKKLFIDIKFKKLTPRHNLFKCYFKLYKWPHMQGRNNGVYGAYHKKHLIALIYSSDLHCGWVDVGWFSYTNTQNAYRMGVNLYVYAMNN